MTALTTRDALAKALCREYHPMHWDVGYGNRSRPCEACKTHAARLLASGAVIDAATLADDEALIDVAMRGAWEGDPHKSDRTLFVQGLRALAAALTERAK